MAGSAIGQQKRVFDLLAQNHYVVDEISKSTPVGKAKLFVEMDYGRSTIKNPDVLKQIRGATIEQVDLVYTDFSVTPSFNQGGLNQNRVNNLYRAAPEVFENFLTAWNAIAQNGMADRDEAQQKFHGFVITYRPAYSEKDSEEDIEYLRNILEQDRGGIFPEEYGGSARPYGEDDEEGDASNKIIYDNPYRNLDLDELNDVDRDLVEKILKLNFKKGVVEKLVVEEGDIEIDGKVQMYFKTQIVVRDGIPETYVDREWFDPKGDPLNVDRIFLTNPDRDIESVGDGPGRADTVIFKVMKRHQEWDGVLLAVDVTGSMTPYSAQVFIWLNNEINTAKVREAVFFNDGDRKVDKRKKPGKTGGLYTHSVADFEATQEVALTAMKNGSGGDTPENNIEALLEGLKNCPDCKDVILIADNMASPRDMELVGELDRPVKVIVCGVRQSVNVDYVNLAYKTGGSLHLLNEDLADLSGYQEGDELVILNTKYRVVQGSFQYVLPEDW